METVIVKMGEIHVTQGEFLLETFGVGSCIAVILYDPEKSIAGMMHAMLTTDKATQTQMATNPLRYVELAIPELMKEMMSAGASKQRLKASIAGGAQMFTLYRDPSNAIGPKNVEAAKKALTALGIPIEYEDTGGTKGRNVRFELHTGKCVIETK